MVIRTLLPLPLLLILVLFTGTASAAKLDAPWTGSGTGATKVVSNGVAADPQFDYSAVALGTWTFSNVAATTRQVPVAYDYSGFHSWFAVRVKIVAFVSRGGKDVWTSSLADQGPVNCCAAPSGGFAYKGQTSFDVRAGDVYGFRLAGSNGDADPTVRGSLKLQEVDTTAPAVTPVVTGTQLAGGLYAGPVDVSWTIADGDSRIVSSTGCAPVTVAAGEDKSITCKASSRGGETTKSMTIKRDRDAPSLTVPSALVKQAAGAAGSAVVTYDASATDTIDPAPAVACMPASGSALPLGTTTVTCTATDASGNSATKSFDAIVFPGVAPAQQPSVNPSSGGPAAPAPKAINAVVAFRFTISKSTTRLIQLRVKNLPKGATVTVTCKGGSCPKKLRGAGSVMTSKGTSLSLSTLVRANLKGGTTINIAISASGALTTIKSLAVRKGKAPVVNTCTASGTKPVAC